MLAYRNSSNGVPVMFWVHPEIKRLLFDAYFQSIHKKRTLYKYFLIQGPLPIGCYIHNIFHNPETFGQ